MAMRAIQPPMLLNSDADERQPEVEDPERGERVAPRVRPLIVEMGAVTGEASRPEIRHVITIRKRPLQRYGTRCDWLIE